MVSLLAAFIFIIIFSTVFSNVYGIGLFEAKKAYGMNSDKVCGNKLCSENSPETMRKPSKNPDSPLGQFHIGIPLDKIRCKGDYKLVFKASNWHPACVRPEDVDRLIEISWAVSKTEQANIIQLAKSGYSSDVAEELRIPKTNVTKIAPQTLVPDYGLTITPEIEGRERFLKFEGFGWGGFHVVTIEISNDQDYFYELKTKTGQGGDLFMPWKIPEDLSGGLYNIFAFTGDQTYEIDIPIASGESAVADAVVTREKCTTINSPVDWSGCDLYGVDLRRIDLRSANLAGANLLGITLSHKDLTGVDFTSANLKGANLDSAVLIGANFVNANLFDTDIRDADLRGANLSYAKLSQADLTSSNLTGANLSYTTLTETILAFTDLNGANLEGAGIWNANLNHCYNHPICN